MSTSPKPLIERTMRSWRLFASGRPGLRFRERYRLRQSRRRGGLHHPARLLHLAGGTALIVFSAFFGWLPILGWGTVFLGLAMIAGESYPAARLMDRLEPRARRLFGPLRKKLAGLPVWAQLSVALTISLATLALVYRLCSLLFG